MSLDTTLNTVNVPSILGLLLFEHILYLKCGGFKIYNGPSMSLLTLSINLLIKSSSLPLELCVVKSVLR